MGFAVSIDGRVGSPEEVTLKVTDNGFVFGDSAYETLRTYGGRPFELDRHLVRLRRTIGLLGFDLRTSDDEIKARIDACLSFAGNAESYLRVIVSRGVGDMSYRFERIAAPTMAIYVKPLEPQSEALYEKGAAAVIA
ncbi:MAG TPA: aminotransferase class IV, partial [Vicinamibacteria bacterium]|nr:aminotransferase class IV [Vicinamibacteria bacterium]